MDNYFSQPVKKFSKKIFKFVISERFAFILIGIGILLRLKYYLENCSFCSDESYWAALEIVHRSWREIFSFTRIYSSFPMQPLIFSVLAKALVCIFGNYEYALRLVPFLSGVLSVILFYSMLKRYASPLSRPFALILFILCDQAIYYSAVIKLYATDILVAILIYLLFDVARKREFNLWLGIIGGLVGAVMMWASHAAMFVLGGVGVGLIFSLLKSRRWGRILPLAICFITWIISFIVLYQMFSLPMATNQELIGMWQNYNPFMPRPYLSIESVVWLKNAFLKVFQNPLGLAFPLLAAMMFFMGCYSVYRRDRERLVVFFVPPVLTLLAGILHKYPFCCRLLLFLTPALLILIAEGVLFVVTKLKGKAKIIGFIIAAILLYKPLMITGYYFFHGRCPEDNRAAMQYLFSNYQPGGG